MEYNNNAYVKGKVKRYEKAKKEGREIQNVETLVKVAAALEIKQA